LVVGQNNSHQKFDCFRSTFLHPNNLSCNQGELLKNQPAFVAYEDSISVSEGGITGIGPKIKIAPIKSLPRFSYQGTLLIPLKSDLESRSASADNPFLFIEWDRNLWINQFFYDMPLGEKYQLFFQLSAWISFTKESYRANPFVETPMSVFFSYFPNSRWTLYAMTEYWPDHVEDSNQNKETKNNQCQFAAIVVRCDRLRQLQRSSLNP